MTPRTTWWPVPELVGERVRLRPHTDADLPRIAEACGDPRSRHRLQIGASRDNAASRHVAERAGFTLVGEVHQDAVVGVGADRTLDDGVWYELLTSRRR